MAGRSSASSSSIVFTEKQPVARVWWISAVVVLGAVVVWVLFVAQVLLHHRLGNNPPSNGVLLVLWLGFGIGAPQVLAICSLTVVVRAGEILVSYPPLANRRIPLADVLGAEAVTYRPMGDYWGWGVRGRRANLCYTVRGHHGVRLHLTQDRQVLLGSQRSEQLAEAISGQLTPR
jgi:hypothetical protein